MRAGLILLVAAALALLLVAAEAPAPPLGEVLHLEPAYRRIELPSESSTSAVVLLRAERGAMLLAGTSECPCVSLVTATPLALPAGVDVPLSLRVSGLLPGVKTVALRTTAGVIELRIQVVSQGRGEGAAIWDEVRHEAAAQGWSLTVLIHDLGGALRNCGCSGGSLGGIDLLAGLARSTSGAGPATRLVLSGDVDGAQPGVGAALVAYGWELRPGDVLERAAAADIGSAPASALVVTGDLAGPEHARLVRAPPARGLAAVVLLRDAALVVRGRHLLPIDRSLPRESAILAAFAEQLTGTLIDGGPPAQDCAGCHPQAQAAWVASRHAQALSSLPSADRRDGCIACHATATPATAPVEWRGGVHCASCHQGGGEHARSGGTVHTGGSRSCAACHDTQHHPAFDRDTAWACLAHGRER